MLDELSKAGCKHGDLAMWRFYRILADIVLLDHCEGAYGKDVLIKVRAQRDEMGRRWGRARRKRVRSLKWYGARKRDDD